MLNSLFPQINWEKIRFAGFDLDGVLYDEFDFISQVYRPISQIIASATGADEMGTYEKLLQRWLEKGSSYNRIFSEALQNSGMDEGVTKSITDECLSLFRNFQPVLSLSPRTLILLDFMVSRFKLFLVTDGSCALQQAKFKALSLEQWFNLENIVISGCAGKNYEKPSIESLGKIGVLGTGEWEGANTVYFGDRKVDSLFAKASGFQFVSVKNMFNVQY
ncbi:MAG: HAD hydrolase-like protein [Sulfuricellaceae bacterium]